MKKKPAGTEATSLSETTASARDQALYRFLVDSLTDYAVFAVSPNGNIISWNAGAEKIFGYKQAEIVGRSFSKIFTNEDVQAGEPNNELASASAGKEFHHDRWHVCKDGSRFWGTNTLNPLYDAAGALIGFTKLVRDATQSHAALEELSDSEQQLRLLIESASDTAIFAIDLDGTVKSWNAGAEKVFGYTHAEVVERNVSMLFSATDRNAGIPAAELREATIHGYVDEKRWLVRKDGSRFLASGKLNQLKPDASGALRGFVKIAHDITENDAAYQLERKWSKTFQHAVLPATLIDVLGLECDALYEPGASAEQVGGDWYDAVRLPDGRVLVTIGDVTGRGLEAAVVVGVVRQIMRGIAQLHPDPTLVLDAADRALALEYPNVYVTAWVGILDLITRTITFSCAGHPPAILASSDGSVRDLGDPGLPIGLRGGVRGASDTVAWSDGDTLILYTDGLTEATRDIIAGLSLVHEAARNLGSAAWKNPAREIRQAVVPGGSPDDVAILILRVDFVAFEQQVDRWHLNALDAVAATALRKKFLASLLDRDFSPTDIANAEIVFGELIGNVVRHAGGNYQTDIVVDHSGPQTVLHVLDCGTGFRYVSRLAAPDPYSETGRGLFLIGTMTADCQINQRPNGGSYARAVLQGRFARPLATVMPMDHLPVSMVI